MVKRNYDHNFFKTWTPQMSYVLGFLFADGNIIKTKRNTYFVSLYSSDVDLVCKIKKLMKSDHKISESISNSGSVFRIQIGSFELFNDLVALGLSPRKSLRMTLPTIPDKYIGDFVRGYFDGDGNVWTGLSHKKRGCKTITLQVCFTSASYFFLKISF